MTAAPLASEIKIDPDASAEEARAFLENERILAAYALADIDQPELEGSRWWVARRDGEIRGLVLVVEALNTCLETLCDLVSPTYHPLVKKCKDVSAAAVLISALAAVGVAALLFLPRLR